MKKWIRRTVDFLNETKDEHLGAFAGQAAFFIFLSIFPLLNIILMLTPLLPFSEQELVDVIIRIIPREIAGFVRELIDDIFSNGTPTITIVAIVTGLWSASKGIMAIRNGLNEVCRKKEKMNFILARVVSALYTGVFILMLFAVTLVNLFGNQIGEYVVQNHSDLAHIATFLMSIKWIISFLLTFLMILILYTILPARKMLMRYQVVGSALCAGAWMLLSWGFSIYISYTMKKSYMYGSLATIIMLLLWLYFVVNIILWCAQVNEFLYLHVYREKADRLLKIKKAKKAARKEWICNKLHIRETPGDGS